LAQIRRVVFEKNANNAPLIPRDDVTEPNSLAFGSMTSFFGIKCALSQICA